MFLGKKGSRRIAQMRYVYEGICKRGETGMGDLTFLKIKEVGFGEGSLTKNSPSSPGKMHRQLETCSPCDHIAYASYVVPMTTAVTQTQWRALKSRERCSMKAKSLKDGKNKPRKVSIYRTGGISIVENAENSSTASSCCSISAADRNQGAATSRNKRDHTRLCKCVSS